MHRQLIAINADARALHARKHGYQRNLDLAVDIPLPARADGGLEPVGKRERDLSIFGGVWGSEGKRRFIETALAEAARADH